ICEQKKATKFRVQQGGRKHKTADRQKEKVIGELNVQDLHDPPVREIQFWKLGPPIEQLPKPHMKECKAQGMDAAQQQKGFRGNNVKFGFHTMVSTFSLRSTRNFQYWVGAINGWNG